MEKWREDIEHEIAMDFIKWLNKPELAPIFAQSDESKEAMRNWLKNNQRQVEQKCENCKHWRNGQCPKIYNHNNEALVHIGIINNEDTTWIRTSSDFGCTLFERKGGE